MANEWRLRKTIKGIDGCMCRPLFYGIALVGLLWEGGDLTLFDSELKRAWATQKTIRYSVK
jgi:hypothetical protein